MNQTSKALIYLFIAILVRYVAPILLIPLLVRINDIEYVQKLLPLIQMVLATIRWILIVCFFRIISDKVINIPLFKVFRVIVCLVLFLSVVEYSMSWIIISYNLYYRLYNIIVMFYYFAAAFFFFYIFILFVSKDADWMNRLMILLTSVGVLILTNFIGNSLLNDLMLFFNSDMSSTIIETYKNVVNVIVFLMFAVQAFQIYKANEKVS